MSNACDSPQTAQERIESQARQQHCLRRAVSVLGALFSVLTVAINLADVVTDTIVAVQFYRDGHMTWFWLVLSSLLIAHVVFTILGAQALTRECLPCLDRKPAWLRYSVAFVFAQLMPFLSVLWPALGKLRKSFERSRRRCLDGATTASGTDSDSDGPEINRTPIRLPNAKTVPYSSAATNASRLRSTTEPRQGIPLSAQEELDTIAASSYINQVMSSAALKEHLMKYGLFYVESAVEAAPQAIIQLLAITFLGRASPAQLVSLCCSLFSITSKAFIISQSYDVRLIVFKFALAAHDVFSTFYLFSTLVAQETHKDTDFFGLEVSWLGYVWLWKVVVYAALALITGLGVLLSQIAYAVIHKDVVSRLREFLAMVAVFIGAFGPGMLCLEACKLSWYTIFTVMAHDSGHTDPKNALASAFIAGAEDPAAAEERRRHVLRCAVAHAVYCHGSLGRADDVRQQEAAMASVEAKPYIDRVRYARQLLHDGNWLNEGYLAHECTGYQKAAAPATFYRPLWDDLLDPHNAGAAPLSNNKLARYTYSAWGTHAADLRRGDRNANIWWCVLRAQYVRGEKKRFPLGWCVMLGCVLAVGQLISFAYPFANAARQFGTHNLLQATCFYATCAALLLALATLPWAVRAYRFDMTVKRVLSASSIGLEEVLAWLADFHEPPHVACLQEAVPVAVLPAEVTAVCGAFLSAGDVGLGALTVAECTALRRRLAARGGLMVQAAGIDIPGAPAAAAAASGRAAADVDDRRGSDSDPVLYH